MDRDALLARIIAEGDRRRDRRPATIGGALAGVVLLLGVAVAWPGGTGDEERVDIADTEASTTTTGTATTGTTGTTTVGTATTAVLEPGATASTAAAAEPPDATATTSVTEPELVCRNSYDERCGPFFWDLPPGFVNHGITVTADDAPLRAIAGQEVVLRFSAHDPDAGACVDTIDVGGGRYMGDEHRCLFAACGTVPRFGPWDPPAIEDSASPGFVAWPDARAVYDTAGTYTITVTALSRTRCGGADLYHSSATATFTIEVTGP